MSKRKKIKSPVAKKKTPTLTVVGEVSQIAICESNISGLQADVKELKADLVRLATLIGHTFGEPLGTQAHAIATKIQGPS